MADSWILWFVVTIVVAGIGSYICTKLKAPAGALIGAIAFVAALQIISGKATFPSTIKPYTSTITGIFLGSRIRREELYALKHSTVPAIIMLSSMLVCGILCGGLLIYFGGLDIYTALYASSPGGITQMSLAAHDVGANAAAVSSIQFARMFTIMIVSPLLYTALLKKVGSDPGKEYADESINDNSVPASKGTVIASWIRYPVTIFVGFASGMLGKISGIPAGTIAFAMAGTAAANLLFGKIRLPRVMQRIAQCLNGAIIGVGFALEDIVMVSSSWLLILIVIAIWIALNFGLAFLFVKRCNMSLTTALFATAAGGLTDMSLLASEYGGNLSQVSVLQLVRNLFVVLIYPLVPAVMTGIAALF